jgi:hypothetical protein
MVHTEVLHLGRQIAATGLPSLSYFQKKVSIAATSSCPSARNSWWDSAVACKIVLSGTPPTPTGRLSIETVRVPAKMSMTCCKVV